MNSEKQSTNLQMTLREVNRVGEGQKNVPKLRFKGYEDAWEQRKLGEVLDFSLKTNSLSRSMLNYEEGELKNIHYGDILMDYGPILNFKTDTIPYITEGKVEEFTSQLLINGDVVFADAAEDESVGKAIEINGLEEQCLVSGLHTIVGRPTIKFAERFLGYYINSNSYHNQLLPLMQGTKVSSISKTTLQKTMIIYPKVNSEQLKIGSFFYCLESIITLHQRKYDALKSMKKTLLSKMFPKNGEDVPEIRFKEFTDAWEQRKLGSDINVTSVKRVHQSDWETEGVPFYRARDIVSEFKGEEISEPIFVSKKTYEEFSRISGKVQADDLLVTGVGTIGVPYLVKSNNPLYFKDGNVIWIQNNKKLDGYFLFYTFITNPIQNFIRESAGTGTVGTLTIETCKRIPVFIPGKREQIAVGEFFQSLDNLITLHQRKLEELKNMKKTLLQQMFV